MISPSFIRRIRYEMTETQALSSTARARARDVASPEPADGVCSACKAIEAPRCSGSDCGAYVCSGCGVDCSAPDCGKRYCRYCATGDVRSCSECPSEGEIVTLFFCAPTCARKHLRRAYCECGQVRDFPLESATATCQHALRVLSLGPDGRLQGCNACNAS